jgi:Ser/Thr protein kinase RdoA (MazF antagonist)
VQTGSFDLLSPEIAMHAVESASGKSLDRTLESYHSYVNRVYGMRTEDGERLVAKFYRPGRWTRQAILDEHSFLLDCAVTEIPVIAPLRGLDGQTLHAAIAPAEGGSQEFLFALFPRIGGRTFEPETDDDFLRLGALLGRCHAAGARRDAPARSVCSPELLTAAFVEELLSDGLVHPDHVDKWKETCGSTLRDIAPLFLGVPFQRIHGDCHRANIIDRPGTGLALIDFDDMMTGPAVQDLWLVLPSHTSESRRELNLLLDGYEQFAAFDASTLRLIEPLRFMRMIYFLAWRARQRNDAWFRGSFPEWGSEAFWIKETEDLLDQARIIRGELGRDTRP